MNDRLSHELRLKALGFIPLEFESKVGSACVYIPLTYMNDFFDSNEKPFGVIPDLISVLLEQKEWITVSGVNTIGEKRYIYMKENDIKASSEILWAFPACFYSDPKIASSFQNSVRIAMQILMQNGFTEVKEERISGSYLFDLWLQDKPFMF